MIEHFKELQRIADMLDDKDDADILRAASIKLIPMPEPEVETVEEIRGWGHVVTRLY